jgi:hypothetical protein
VYKGYFAQLVLTLDRDGDASLRATEEHQAHTGTPIEIWERRVLAWRRDEEAGPARFPFAKAPSGIIGLLLLAFWPI